MNIGRSDLAIREWMNAWMNEWVNEPTRADFSSVWAYPRHLPEITERLIWHPGYVWHSGKQMREQFNSPSNAYFLQGTESSAQNLKTGLQMVRCRVVVPWREQLQQNNPKSGDWKYLSENLTAFVITVWQPNYSDAACKEKREWNMGTTILDSEIFLLPFSLKAEAINARELRCTNSCSQNIRNKHTFHQIM